MVQARRSLFLKEKRAQTDTKHPMDLMKSNIVIVAALVSRSVILVLLISLIGIGCATQAPVIVSEVESIPDGPTSWAEVERVELENYPDEPRSTDRIIVHDVPAALMSNSADKGQIELVEGFRIQIFASEVRNDAVQAEEQVRVWLRSLSDERKNVLGLKTQPTIYSFYKQPYYRVRMGDFETRAQAQPILDALKSRFSGALIVPDTVEIRR